MIEGGIEVDAVNQAMDRSDWPANRMMRVTELSEAAVSGDRNVHRVCDGFPAHCLSV